MNKEKYYKNINTERAGCLTFRSANNFNYVGFNVTI